jgi:pyruvate dehydrogenase E1 component
MFGFQRVGDLIWALADARGRGFLLGGTAGRTTLAGEGLQHSDGHSLLLASVVPSCLSYDPAFAYEVATLIEEGMRRMLVECEDVFYYLALYNEAYPMPAMPPGPDVRDGIVRGLYRYRSAPGLAVAPAQSKGGLLAGGPAVQLLGSGPILREALRAAALLLERHGVAADVWSATSYGELRREALAVERWNRLHPLEPERVPYVTAALAASEGPIVAASDYLRAVPDQIARFVPRGREYLSLGTDGFGCSDTRPALRRLFEVDAEHIAVAALAALARAGSLPRETVARAIAELGLDPEARGPVCACSPGE